jgi:hypothetical protein
MAKKLFRKMPLTVAGWISFVSGILVTEPVAKIVLLSIARVLPKALLRGFLPD